MLKLERLRFRLRLPCIWIWQQMLSNYNEKFPRRKCNSENSPATVTSRFGISCIIIHSNWKKNWNGKKRTIIMLSWHTSVQCFSGMPPWVAFAWCTHNLRSLTIWWARWTSRAIRLSTVAILRSKSKKFSCRPIALTGWCNSENRKRKLKGKYYKLLQETWRKHGAGCNTSINACRLVLMCTQKHKCCRYSVI
jgi:hypothetical protein